MRFVTKTRLAVLAAGSSQFEGVPTVYAALVSPTTWVRSVDPRSTYQEWDIFSSTTGPNPPNSPGNPPTAVVDAAPFNTNGAGNVWDTSGESFLTSGGNIYSPTVAIDIDVTIPNYAASPATWTTVLLQTRTLGNSLDLGGVRLTGPGGTAAPVDSALMFTQELGGFGGTLEDRWFEFIVPGNAGSYTLEFAGATSSVSIDKIAVDTIWTDAATGLREPNPVGPPAATVVARKLFYNNSNFDGDAAASAADDLAVASDKLALLAGNTASLSHYSSYARGINGVMIDVANLPAAATLEADDFQFRVGNNNSPSAWNAAPAPSEISVRRGAGQDGSDRVTLIWPDGAVKKTWLQVSLLPTDDTGLEVADVFYFGNAIGETGNSTANAVVNAGDEIGARVNSRNPLNPAPLTFAYDFNRDKLVNAADQILARVNSTNPLTSLVLISVPAEAGSGLAAGAVPEPSTLLLAVLGCGAATIWTRRRRGRRHPGRGGERAR